MAIKGRIAIGKNKGKYITINLYRYENRLYMEIYDGDIRTEECFFEYCRAFNNLVEVKNWLMLVEEMPEITVNKLFDNEEEI